MIQCASERRSDIPEKLSNVSISLAKFEVCGWSNIVVACNATSPHVTGAISYDHENSGHGGAGVPT